MFIGIFDIHNNLLIHFYFFQERYKQMEELVHNTWQEHSQYIKTGEGEPIIS